LKSSQTLRFLIVNLFPKPLVAISHELHPCPFLIVQRSVAKYTSMWLIRLVGAVRFL